MTGKARTPDLKDRLVLAPQNTPQGAMERVFLAETYGPQATRYDASTDLAQMRDMRQVIESRLNAPADYEARGAKNEIDILKAPNQFQDFSDYPDLPSKVKENIIDDLRNANDVQFPQHADYAQHVQDAITAATESITHPVAGYPQATAWVTEGHECPGPNFYVLGTVGGNTFYGTLPRPSEAAKPEHKADNLEGMTFLEKLRYYKAQALADAAKKPVPPHMALHHMIMRTHRNQISFAPVRRRLGTAAGGDVRSGPAFAYDAIRRSTDEFFRRDATDEPSGMFTSARETLAAASANRAMPPSAESQAAVGGNGPRQSEPVYFWAADGSISQMPGNAASAAGMQMADDQMSKSDLDRQLRQELNDYFDQQSRLPPRGATGFDPRLTPAWAGLSIPGQVA